MDQEKLQALANHLEIDYFNHNDTYYVGASQEECKLPTHAKRWDGL